MKIFDESLYCQECQKEITVQEAYFLNDHCEECFVLIQDTQCEVYGIDENGNEYDLEPVEKFRPSQY